MASRQSVSSILKPPKVRAPLKEIETVDQDADENTATLSKRKVSFSGMNKIKMYNTGATSLTVHQAPMFDEQISMLSDSSNVEKPKTSGKFEKSDAQISIESTNCTNLEDNGRIIIEYESPNDNMEMTEALSGKILSDTIYTIDNNGSEHISYSSDYSENNMEFTEALKVGQILSGDNGCDLSSTEMSETLVDESGEESVSQFGLIPSTPLSDVPIKNTLNISSNSSCMDFTCANTKSNLLCNTQSSNMELTCMTKSLKSIWSSDDYKSMNMELTQLPDRQTFEDNCELVYECSEHSISMGSDISCEIQERSSCESEIVQTKKSENNNSNFQTIGCGLDKSDTGEDFIEELSLSMVSMDIDPTLEDNAFEISYVNVDDPLRVLNEQKLLTIPMTAVVENSCNPEQSVLDNYSNIIDSNQTNESRLSILPTGSSFVVNMSPEKNINQDIEIENLLQQTLHNHTSVLDKNQYLENKSIIVENNLQKKNYSRKTMVHTCPLNVQDSSFENEDTSGTVDNQQKHYSRKSIVPTTVFKDDISDTSVVLEENQQEKYSRKSIAPTTVFNDDISDTSVVLEENQQEKYSRKSIAPTTVNDDISDASIVLEENQQEKYSRKSIAPTTVFNDDISDTSVVLEENQQEEYSRKSIAPTTVNDDISDASIVLVENQQEKYSRKSIAPTTVFNDDISDTSVVLEENQQEKYSRKSIAPTTVNDDISDTSVLLEENQQEKYSRKSIAPTTVFNDDISDTSVVLEENQQEEYSRKSIAPTTVFNDDISDAPISIFYQSQSFDSENLSNTSGVVEENNQIEYSRKSVAPLSVFNEDAMNTSEILEQNQQQNCSLQSIAMSVYNQTKSLRIENVSNISENISVYNPTQFAEKCDTSEYHPTWSAEKEETSLNNLTQSGEKEEISLYNSTQSAEKEDTSEIIEEYQRKRYSRKSVGPTSLVFTHSESLDVSMSNNSLNTEESDQLKSDEALDSEISVTVNNQSNLQSDVSIHNEDKSISKSQHQSVLLNLINDDNFNSPFRKKSKKSVNLTHLIKSPAEDQCTKNELEITNDNFSENFENVSKMDISMEHEIENDNIIHNSFEFLVDSNEGKKVNKSSVHDHMCETNKELIVMALDELEINKTNLNEFVKDNDIVKESEYINEENNKNNSIKVTDNIKATNHILTSNDHSPSCNEDKTTKTICVKDIANISSDKTLQNNEKPCLVNRKRSYSNRDCAPLSCSSFMSKPNICHSMDEDFITDDFIQQSPIKNDVINKSLNNEQLVIGNELQENLIKNESIKENLCNEVLEFLTRWNEQFIETKLVLDKCTNREWIFNVLDSNIILTITYSNISNNYSFLKVEDISLTSKTIAKNEIIKFGINWILSKYNPKVYKQICFTSRDVELLLKSLLDDVHYINKVMNNMSYVSDIYCVTFKDNKAQFVVHNMKCPLMVRIEITLSNIHKLTIKDLSVDCLFGHFNTKLLEEIMEDVTKDCNVLQSFVEKLFKLYSHQIN
ncbi:repetitive organellar protein [Rhopalosiphum padi]|uniref:repetitive organellar protein n=1 Tax=Rhopalosiphum padi TaxID=40932 RepID=UPI00298DB1BD|nr:repetitive organellar protein [Rhopalosiphum padi]